MHYFSYKYIRDKKRRSKLFKRNILLSILAPNAYLKFN